MKTQGNESIVNANNYSEKKCTLHSLTLFKVIYPFPVQYFKSFFNHLENKICYIGLDW